MTPQIREKREVFSSCTTGQENEGKKSHKERMISEKNPHIKRNATCIWAEQALPFWEEENVKPKTWKGGRLGDHEKLTWESEGSPQTFDPHQLRRKHLLVTSFKELVVFLPQKKTSHKRRDRRKEGNGDQLYGSNMNQFRNPRKA